jgi:hypothetical protein
MAEGLSGIWVSRRGHLGYETSWVVDVDDLDATVFVDGRSNSEGSELTMELASKEEERRVLGGSWKETTSLIGEHKGKIFEGFVSFVLDESLQTAKGLWISSDMDESRTISGWWTLEKEIKVKRLFRRK